MAARKQRLDVLLVARGLAPTRAKAQALVLAGEVLVDGARAEKAGAMVAEGAALSVREKASPYVSRGGTKLEGALATLGVHVEGKNCLDVGASTGGFTDCLLAHGARSVVAVDVGYGQLAHKLRIDPRVTVLERTNARNLTPDMIGGAADLTVVDASFIGLRQLAPALARCTRSGGELVALVKPQFEVGREEASRTRGVVRDERTRTGAIEQAVAAIAEVGFDVLGRCDSALAGPKGNREAFVHARRA